MEKNKIYHLNFLDNNLPDKCANVIIGDPPYFEVKGEFDYIWASFQDYLKDVELWAKECKRILADNGTLFWYGDRKKIAYSQVILDKYFNLEENITIHIFDRQTNKIPAEDATSFINVTEHLLMYSNGNQFTNILNAEKIKQNLKEIDFRKLKKSKNGKLTGWCSNILKGKNVPVRKEWELICSLIGHSPYDGLRRKFNIQEKYKTNVLRISQEGHKTGNYDHDTVKPELLSRILIDATTQKNDLVVIPFSGSGTECAMAKKENRNYIGFDIEKKYVDMANNRCRNIGASLF